MIRKKLIAGNWKMNKTSADAKALVEDIVSEVGNVKDVDIVVSPPFTSLETVGQAVDGSNVKLGAQNMHPEPSGAYTGEVSAEMLRSTYTRYVILGHSERRAYFGESDEFVNQKVLAALKAELKPILCVGETLEEREAGDTLKVVQTQLEGGLAGTAEGQATEIVIAYEPVWAIGTGKVATTQQAQEVHAFIRELLGKLLSPAAAGKIRILYGGSMKPGNAPELLAEADIDGGLIGGASLEARSFVQLVQAAQPAE